MVGSNGTMIAIRLVRSKLRKREDHGGNEAHTEPSVVQTAPPPQPSPPPVSTVRTVNGVDVVDSVPEENHAYANDDADQFIWQFPPPYPPPQYTLYNDQATLVHALDPDRSGFANYFRKNFGGRWRWFIRRKTGTETCAIPPELKDQLKTIYVY